MQMNKYRIDALERFDATYSQFFARQLEFIRPSLFEISYPEFQARTFLPINNSVGPGAAEYTYRTFDRVGRADIVADYGKDFPRVDIYGAEVTTKIVSIGDSYGWSIQEARSAQMAGLDLDGRKARAARFAIEAKLDDLLLNGDSDLGLEGLFALSGITTYTVTTGAGGVTFDVKTGAEVLVDLHGAPLKAHTDSKGIERPDTVIMPLTTYGLLSTVQVGGGDSRTLLAKYLADDQFIKNVYTSHLLETAGSGGAKRMIFYKKSPDVLEGLIPQEFEQFAPEFHSMQVVTTCHARCGGVIVYRPKAVVYADGV